MSRLGFKFRQLQGCEVHESTETGSVWSKIDSISNNSELNYCQNAVFYLSSSCMARHVPTFIMCTIHVSSSVSHSKLLMTPELVQLYRVVTTQDAYNILLFIKNFACSPPYVTCSEKRDHLQKWYYVLV